MIDIVKIEDGGDLRVADAVSPKAAAIVSVQVGSLEYAPNLGVDKRYFLQEGLEFPLASWKSHVVEQLTKQMVNVFAVRDLERLLDVTHTFEVGDGQDTTGALII